MIMISVEIENLRSWGTQRGRKLIQYEILNNYHGARRSALLPQQHIYFNSLQTLLYR